MVTPKVQLSPAEAAGLIDHTLLKPEATRADVQRLCKEALHWKFAAVCVNPWYVAPATECVSKSEVRVATVIGFPLGATFPQVKISEAEEAMQLGAREIDMVINIGALKSGDWEVVEAEVRDVARASHRQSAICKVILETALLTQAEKERAARTAQNAGADFVKTSTGFGAHGATVEDVQLLRRIVGDGIGVKAAGGIRSWMDMRRMVAAGATRIGTSSGVKIMEEAIADLAADAGTR